MVGCWNVNGLQKRQEIVNAGEKSDESSKRYLNEEAIQDLVKKYRAVEFGLNLIHRNKKPICYSIGCLEAEITYWNLNAQYQPNPVTLNQSFLLLGLEVILDLQF